MRVLVVGHTAPGGVFTVGSHHLVRELAARGHHVGHLSTPVSLLHATRLKDPEVRRRTGLAVRRHHEAAPGVPGLLPLTALPLSVGPLHTGPLALRTAVPPLRRRLAALGLASVDVLLVDQPLAAGIEDLVDARAVVYRSTDLVESRAKLRAEQRLLRRADALVATSHVVLDRLRETRPDLPSLVLDNGVDFHRFADAGPRDADDRRSGADRRSGVDRRDGGRGGEDAAEQGSTAEDRRVGDRRRGAVYVGAVDERFDFEALAAFARSNPEKTVDVYGPASVPVPPLPPNVVVHGGVPYASTPELMRHASVGLLPLHRTDLNRGRSPMKLFEYLAAGLQVVTTVPPSVRPVPPGVHVVDHPGDERAAGERAFGAGVNTEGVAAARGMDWSDRALRLEHFLEGVLAGPGA